MHAYMPRVIMLCITEEDLGEILQSTYPVLVLCTQPPRVGILYVIVRLLRYNGVLSCRADVYSLCPITRRYGFPRGSTPRAIRVA